MNKLAVLLILTFMFAVGCGKSSGGASAGGTSKTVLVNGKNPQDYYNQFLYRVSGTCEKGNIYFYFLETSDIFLDDALDGSKMRGALAIYLNKDQSYSAAYEERKIRNYTDSGYAYDVAYKTEIKGKWSVSADGIIYLENIGTGKALKYNNSESIDLSFARNLHHPGMVGDFVILGFYSSTAGPVSSDEYCSREGVK